MSGFSELERELGMAEIRNGKNRLATNKYWPGFSLFLVLLPIAYP
jgi:hypothetical protein